MAIATGNTNTRATSGLEPYYKRIEPLDGGYALSRASGTPLGEVRVFDDREQDGTIHVQFSTGRGKWTKVSTMHCESVDEYREIIEALSLGEKLLSA